MATLIRSDLEFILQQILIAEAQAAGADPASLVPNAFAPFGLRTVDGSYNNLMPGQSEFGAADNPFPQLVPQTYSNEQDDAFAGITNTDYGSAGNVVDADPRLISNLVADMTSNNPAAVSAFVAAGLGTLDAAGVLYDLQGVVIPPGTLLEIPNTSPDEGLSAPFNSWFTFFGQFFDHGLDLVNKNSTEMIFMPLQPDDPLFSTAPGAPNFMILSRATRDANGDQTNQTTPFVDQNQTYTSHPSHQVFLREYVLDANGRPVATGSLLDGTDGGLANWAQVKAQALMLGIQLDDADVLDLPPAGDGPVRQVHSRSRDRLRADRAARRRRRRAAGPGRQRARLGHARRAPRRQRGRSHRPCLPERHRACRGARVRGRRAGARQRLGRRPLGTRHL
ncbi:peroxidase family protein [Variovorax sp. V512]|uniref:peroxidase family protein n=1 Tax=Variovorax sp. V512 TaxID=3064160 RepID=UPI0032E6D00C